MILEYHLLLAALLVGNLAAAGWLRRRGVRPRAVKALFWIAVASFVLEVVAQAWTWRDATDLDRVAPSERQLVLANAISFAMRLVAYETGVLLFTLVAMAVIWTRRRRDDPAPAGARATSCSECGRDRIAAGALAEGSRVTLCGDCAAAAVARIEAGGEGNSVIWQALADTIERLPELVDREYAESLVDAAAAMAATRPENVRYVAYHAARVWLCERAIELLDGLGSAGIADDRTQIAYLSFMIGDTQRGLATLAAVDRSELDDPQAIYFHLNRAALTLDADGSPAAVAQATADMGEVHALLERCGARLSRDEMSGLLGAEQIGLGRLDLAGERWDSAAGHLRQAIDKYGDRRPFIYVLLGDALAGAGDRDQAETTWGHALELAPPTSFHAGQARSRLGGPYR